MNRTQKWFGVTVAVVLASGCGALFNGGPAPVNFTSTPVGAEVIINGTPRGVTPIMLPLAKNQNHIVLFKMPGYTDFGTSIDRQVSAGYVVLDVLGGILPVVIDAATGSWYTLSVNSVHGSMARPAGTTGGQDSTGRLTSEQLTLVKMGIALDRALELAPAPTPP